MARQADSTRRSPRRAVLVAASAVAAAVVVVLTTGNHATASSTQLIPLPSSGNITVIGHGFGHGHGMSQYGAQGAALDGLTAAQIVAFYYPGTTLVTLAPSTIRVLISNAGTYPTVAPVPGMTLSGVTGTLATTSISRYRLVPQGTGLQLQALVGANWVISRSSLPAQADFTSPQGYVRVYLDDGTSTDYRGTVGGLRSGTSVLTINRVALDSYVEGVAPRESPASWKPAAVQAQAIAARSYGRNAVESHRSSPYDICDDQDCQVYGGMTHYSSSGSVLWTDDPAALTGNANEVLQYGGATIFAQFSSSDGGWTVAGSVPYLVAKADPYDDAASGDPNLNWSASVPVSEISGAYGLSRATEIEITQRDGNGDWGGRVLAGYVDGLDSAGHAQRIATTGFGLQDAMGLRQNWFTVPGTPPSAPTSVAAAAGDAAALITWAAPTTAGSDPITGYLLSAGVHQMVVPATARSGWLDGLRNGFSNTVSVAAVTAGGDGPSASATVTPVALPAPVQVQAPARLFDTRSPSVPVDPAHPYIAQLAGVGSVPSGTGASAVQLAVTIVAPTSNGVLHIYPNGGQAQGSAAIAYQAGRTSTTTVTIPFVPSTKVVFVPTAGSMAVIGDEIGYSAAGGSSLVGLPQVVALNAGSVPTGNGMAVPIRTSGVIPADATAVAVSVIGRNTTAGWLRLWADGATLPGVSQVTVTTAGTASNLVMVPIGADGSIRIASSSSALGAIVSIVGYAAPAATGRGLLESLPVTGLTDAAAHTGGNDLTVGPTAVSQGVESVGQLPASGVQAVLIQVTAAAGTPAPVWVYPAGSVHGNASVLNTSATAPVTATALVPVGAGGLISVITTAASETVSIDVIGYVTTG